MDLRLPAGKYFARQLQILGQTANEHSIFRCFYFQRIIFVLRQKQMHILHFNKQNELKYLHCFLRAVNKELPTSVLEARSRKLTTCNHFTFIIPEPFRNELQEVLTCSRVFQPLRVLLCLSLLIPAIYNEFCRPLQEKQGPSAMGPQAIQPKKIWR